MKNLGFGYSSRQACPETSRRGAKETSRKGIKSASSVEAVWGDKVKPIAISNKAYTQDPRKWLNENVKPVWEN